MKPQTFEQRTKDIQDRIAEYEQDLGPIVQVDSTFNTARLPHTIEQAIQFVVSQAPSFANIAALSAVNFTYGHLCGQTRAVIDDPMYSSSPIGANVYSININGSGQGKSSTARALTDALAPAFSMMEQERMKVQVDIASKIALKELEKDNPNITLEQIGPQHYEQYLQPLPKNRGSVESSKAGLMNTAFQLSQEEFGSLAVNSDELGQSLKNSGHINDTLGFLTECYDTGAVDGALYRGEDSQQRDISGLYVNFLAHTSPKIIFSDPRTTEQLSTIFHTAFARRTFFTFPSLDESVENNHIPKTNAEGRELRANMRSKGAHLREAISTKATESILHLLADPLNRRLQFSEEAADLYDDYFQYCRYRAELMEDSSIQQIEMFGRAFKLGKLAAIWTMVENLPDITTDIVKSVIYYAEYNSKYLDKFVKLTTNKPFKLLAELFKEGKTPYITLDQALTNGYINRVTTEFKELLDPLNSTLRNDGTVIYNQDTRTFIYTAFKKVEPVQKQAKTLPVLGQSVEPQSVTKPTLTAFSASYTKCQDVVKDARQYLLGSFDLFRDTLSFNALKKLVSTDTIYSPFYFKPGTNTKGEPVEHKRGKDFVDSHTKYIVLDVDDSPVPIETIHDYLIGYPHIIATTSDSSNLHKFRIILPINVELDGTDALKYKFVTQKIAADLLLTCDKVSFVTATPYYGYQDALVYSSDLGSLYDITEHLTAYARGEEEIKAKIKKPTKFKTEQGRSNHVNKLLDNILTELSFATNPPGGQGSFALAGASLRMIDEGFNKEEYELAINFIHDQWDSPMDKTRFQTTIVNQFLPRMQ